MGGSIPDFDDLAVVEISVDKAQILREMERN
jgi:hypothetical protein